MVQRRNRASSRAPRAVGAGGVGEARRTRGEGVEGKRATRSEELTSEKHTQKECAKRQKKEKKRVGHHTQEQHDGQG